MYCFIYSWLFIVSGCCCLVEPSLDDLQDFHEQDFEQLGEQGK
jgi:hypothetical protein